MPNFYGDHCFDCTHNKTAASLETPQSELPLSMEKNSGNTLLIFQSPGIYEWKDKKPICSENNRSTAARIRNSLIRIGKCRTEFSITNAVQCFPGKYENGRDKTPSKSIIRCCSNWLKDDISSSDYKNIVVLGAVAKQSVEILGKDERFIFIGHPSGQLKNTTLDDALNK